VPLILGLFRNPGPSAFETMIYPSIAPTPAVDMDVGHYRYSDALDLVVSFLSKRRLGVVIASRNCQRGS
jgi:hypothetical protein